MKFEPLSPFLPEGGLSFVKKWLSNYSVKLIIKNKRASKLGDYKKISYNNSHKISVNNDLKPEAFFFVLTHEIAHLFVRDKFGSKTQAHGAEWKQSFGEMIVDSIAVYPKELHPILLRHATNPRASVGADRKLALALFIDETDEKRVEELEKGDCFRIGRRTFKKGNKRKIRYLCQELNSSKWYTISGLAVIDEEIK